MAFPIIALVASALSDLSKNNDERDAANQGYYDTIQRIGRTRAQQLGAQPYSFMVDDYKNGLQRQNLADSHSRNNQIGSLLQAYLMHKPDADGGGPEKFGDDYDTSDLQGGAGVGNVMGKAQMDPWDKDPWGDAGF